MTDSETARDIERRASSLRAQGRLREAIVEYRRILEAPLSAIDRAKMLANIMGLERDLGDTDAATATATEALHVLESNALRTNEAVFVHGVVTGALRRMRGETPEYDVVPILAAWVTGAALGAAVGSTIAFPWPALLSDAVTDWRHVGAVAGALLGWLLLLRMLVGMGKLASLAALLVNLGVVVGVLRDGPGVPGVVTATVLTLPILAVAGGVVLLNTGRWSPRPR